MFFCPVFRPIHTGHELEFVPKLELSRRKDNYINGNSFAQFRKNFQFVADVNGPLVDADSHQARIGALEQIDEPIVK